ncbi:MAG: putative porin, partial [Steroidobacteraceae bacterium]
RKAVRLVKKILLPTVLAASMTAAPALAQQRASLDQVLRALDALTQRVEKLEQDNTRLEAENAELKARNDRIEATTDYLRANASATRKELAEDAPNIGKIADLEKQAKAAEWANKLSIKGDFRYRHEQVDPEEAITDQTRHRLRARVGLTAKVNDTLSATVQIASDGGNSDPRSTNQTLGDGLTRKGIGIDMAYADWKPVKGFSLQLGKHPYPWQRVASHIWDPDLTWEGGAVRFDRGAFFASAIGSWLQESSSQSDATLIGAQIGFKQDIGAVKLLGAVGYYDVGAAQDEITTTAGTCTANSAFFGGPQGNTTFVGGGCARLLNDYNLLDLLVQADFKIAGLPLILFGHHIQNQEASALDTGYAFGLTLGKAGDPRSWEVGYLYQDVEKDAQFGQFLDSDFGGGVADSKGSVLKLIYAPAKSWTLNGTYFLNERFGSTGAERDYDRLQLDLNYKF